MTDKQLANNTTHCSRLHFSFHCMGCHHPVAELANYFMQKRLNLL